MTPTNKLSPAVQAIIAFVLLVMFAGVLFLPGIVPGFQPEADTKQTLFTLVTAVVFFFIGKNTDSARNEAQLTAAAIAPFPTVPAAPVKVDDSTPIKTQEVKP
jgi:hypothetical protein